MHVRHFESHRLVVSGYSERGRAFTTVGRDGEDARSERRHDGGAGAADLRQVWRPAGSQSSVTRSPRANGQNRSGASRRPVRARRPAQPPRHRGSPRTRRPTRRASANSLASTMFAPARSGHRSSAGSRASTCRAGRDRRGRCAPWSVTPALGKSPQPSTPASTGSVVATGAWPRRGRGSRPRAARRPA
jgi:hypothetical protein